MRVVVFALAALCCVACVSATGLHKLHRQRATGQLSAHAAAEAAATVGTRKPGDENDFWPQSLSTYAVRNVDLFDSTAHTRDPTSHRFDVTALETADQQEFTARQQSFAAMNAINKRLDLTRLPKKPDAKAIIGTGGKTLDSLNFVNAKYYKADPVIKTQDVVFANGAVARLSYDTTTTPLLLKPWLKGVRAGLAILNKHHVQPPANSVTEIHLAKWQQPYKLGQSIVLGDTAVQGVTALADAQAWHWATASALILTPASVGRKTDPLTGAPFGVCDQVLDAAVAKRARAVLKRKHTFAELVTLRSTYNVIHEMVHALHALTPASRALFFETAYSKVRQDAVFAGSSADAVVSSYAGRMSSPREFVAEYATKLLAVAEGALPKATLHRGSTTLLHTQAYTAFGGDAVVPQTVVA